jgi:hypothetical protein
MRIVFPRIFWFLVFSSFCCTCGWAQEATTNHNVILRRDPTTSSPALERLVKGARLTLIDVTPDTGFYHVKTEDDRVGWVSDKFVSISSAEGSFVLTAPITPVPSALATPAATDISGACDSKISTHEYHPNRLIVKQECVAVTGIIVDATAKQSRKQADGTRHEPC